MNTPDTSAASSFNMPFTTMNNYNWLFDVDKTNQMSQSTSNQATFSLIPEIEATARQHQVQTTDCPSTNGNMPDTNRSGRDVNGHTTLNEQPYGKSVSHAKLPPLPTLDQYRYSVTSTTPNAAAITSVSPVSNDSNTFQDRSPTNGTSPSATDSPASVRISPDDTPWANPQSREMNIPPPAFQSHHSLLRGSGQRRMPALDELSRKRALDLLVNARPQLPDGSEITRDHPLLSISSLQNYLDLFFSRFNVAYPLLHQATFDASETEPLLLLAVLLLGATYGEKNSHRLAVCIHDVLRAQIFQHSAFSASPELWMLQTILLVECFGKSRAGQKQHDMAHLFHGLLIKYD
jgi:hypothetical protein